MEKQPIKLNFEGVDLQKVKYTVINFLHQIAPGPNMIIPNHELPKYIVNPGSGGQRFWPQIYTHECYVCEMGDSYANGVCWHSPEGKCGLHKYNKRL